MGVLWFNEKPKEGVATITLGQITLNKPAASFFESAYNIMLGIDKEEKQVIIRPLTKAESLRRDIENTKKYRITVRYSYARVTNKAFVETIIKMFDLPLHEKESIKFPAIWDQKASLLKINLKDVV